MGGEDEDEIEIIRMTLAGMGAEEEEEWAVGRKWGTEERRAG